MIHKPPIDDLAQKVGSKYALCVVASKRARQIMETNQNVAPEVEAKEDKPLSKAAQEIYDGKLISVKD